MGVNVTDIVGTADDGGGATSGTRERHRDVLVLGDTLSTKCNILPFESELYMMAFVSPTSVWDVIDYNGASFDWPYLINRVRLFQFFGKLDYDELEWRHAYDAARYTQGSTPTLFAICLS